MKYAVVKGPVVEIGSLVDSVIVVNPEQKEEMEQLLNATLLEVKPLGLESGDMYNGINWTRNVEGEQTSLPIETTSLDVEEAISILLGEVD